MWKTTNSKDKPLLWNVLFFLHTNLNDQTSRYMPKKKSYVEYVTIIIVLSRSKGQPKGCTESLDRKVVPKVSTERLYRKSQPKG